MPWVSRQSLLSANEGDNEMMPGAVHRFPGTYLMTEKLSGKSQLGDALKKVVRPGIASNGLPDFQIVWLGSHSIPWGEGRGCLRMSAAKAVTYASLEGGHYMSIWEIISNATQRSNQALQVIFLGHHNKSIIILKCPRLRIDWKFA